VFLTAFAIVDDLGAVLVIAVFYSGNISGSMLAAALALLVLLYILSFKGFFSRFLTILVGTAIWVLFLQSGIHPTIAGILVAFSVPVRQKVDTPTFISILEQITQKIRKAKVSEKPILCKEQIEQVDDLEDWIDKYQSPLQHLEHKLHGWVAYFIIPIFALANAGVSFGSVENLDSALIRNIVLCLVLGKGIGISTLVFLARATRLIEIPKDINFRQIIGVSFLAGIGFTMAIFIAGLAFKESPVFIDSAKIGILAGSLISAIAGFTVLRFSSRKSA
jgi:NhaA family Na+:H+ antiporter